MCTWRGTNGEARELHGLATGGSGKGDEEVGAVPSRLRASSGGLSRRVGEEVKHAANKTNMVA